MKAYKGFNKDMTCRGFQFEEGKTYHEENAKLCESGFHACLNPLDCFNYYAPSESVYHEVELNEVLNEKSEDSKICGKTIKIGAKLDVLGMVKIAVNYIKSNIDRSIEQTNTGNWSAATNTGNCSAATNTGNCSAATNTGNCSAATNTGDCSAATVEGKDSIAICCGFDCKARASLGSAICLCERGTWNGDTYPLKSVKAAIVDGKSLKPDTWYKLENGEFVEAIEDEE